LQAHNVLVEDASHVHTVAAPGIDETSSTQVKIADASQVHAASKPFADERIYWYQTDAETFCVTLQ
jgi:hypothetical protein